MMGTMLIVLFVLLLFNTVTMSYYLSHKGETGEIFKERTVSEWTVTQQATLPDGSEITATKGVFPKGIQTVAINGFSPITVNDQLDCKDGVKTNALQVTRGALLGNTLQSDADGNANWGAGIRTQQCGSIRL